MKHDMRKKEILIGFVWKVCKKSSSKAFFHCVASRIVCVCIFFISDFYHVNNLVNMKKCFECLTLAKKCFSVSSH